MSHLDLDWLSRALAADGQLSVGACIPACYTAYARIMHPLYRLSASGEPVPVRWGEIAATHGRTVDDEICFVGIDGQPRERANRDDDTVETRGARPMWDIDAAQGYMPAEVCTALLPALRAATTSQQLVALVCDRFATADYSRYPIAGTFTLNFSRRCFAYQCTFDEIFQLVHEPYVITPALWYPTDRAWCVATDIDHTWSYIGGTERLLHELRESNTLEIVPVSRDTVL
jgi:hypothetical protein